VKKKGITFGLFILIIAGGIFLYTNQQKRHALQQTAQYEKVNQAIMDDDYKTASNELENLEDFEDKEQIESYHKQVEIIQAARQQISELKVNEAQKTLEEITKQEKVLKAVKEKQEILNKTLEEKKVEITSDEQNIVDALHLSEKKEYKQANDLLSELVDKEPKGDFEALVAQAIEQVENNKNALTQAEMEKKEADQIALTEEEALTIAKTNLPDLFNYGQSWSRVDSDESGVFTFNGVNNGPFRCVLVIKLVGEQEVSVKETRDSYGNEEEVSEYTFQRLEVEDNHATAESNQTDILDLETSQKFLDAYNTFSAKGINVMSGNRGSGVLSDQMIAASGLSAEQYYQLDAGIEDYFWNLNNLGTITDDQRSQLILDARKRLLNGDYANN